MNTPADDDLLLDMIESVAVTVLEAVGGDPEAHFQFFKRFVALAQETIRDSGRQGPEPRVVRASAR